MTLGVPMHKHPLTKKTVKLCKTRFCFLAFEKSVMIFNRLQILYFVSRSCHTFPNTTEISRKISPTSNPSSKDL